MSSRYAATFMALVLVPALALAMDTTPGQSKDFKDWAVGCDNQRTCTALGLPTEDGGGAWLRITRGGNAMDAPRADVVVDASGKTRAPLLTLTLGGAAPSNVFAQGLRAVPEGDFVRATLTGADAERLIAALRNAHVLEVRLQDGTKTLSTARVSLAGATAALLHMDDTQKRVGTVTALVKPGNAPASSIPPVAAKPVIVSRPMQEVKVSPALPPALPRASDPRCKDVGAITVRPSSEETLWGVCNSAGAYNVDYRFWIVAGGHARPVSFPLPGQKQASLNVLVSPSILDGGKVLESFDKGRGLGDCGDITDWVWDGKTFRLIAWRKLDLCRGVSQDDWPVLFTANQK